MKPTNDIPTGTDLLIDKIDDLIEVIKHLTATIKKDRIDPEQGVDVPEDSRIHLTDRDSGTRGLDIAYYDPMYSNMTLQPSLRSDSTIINSVPHEPSLNRIRCGIDTVINSAGRDCRSTEVSNERG